MIDATIKVWPEDESLWIFPRDVNITVKGNRFSDEWIEKVENWAKGHAAMIKRYDDLLLYRKMQDLAQELTGWEMHQFYSLEGHISEMKSEEWPGDDIDPEDWPD